MVLKRTLIWILAVVFTAGIAQAIPDTTLLQQILDQSLDGKDLVGVAFSVATGDGKTTLAAASGTMKVETQYSLASVTKLYTGAVIFQLKAKGLLKLEDRVGQYLGDSIDARHITIQQLLSHTSGLPDYWSESLPGQESLENIRKSKDTSYTFQDILALTHKLNPHFKPGEEGKAYYSDTNYQLLGRIIEKVTKESLAQAIREYIVQPLGLKNTYLYEKGLPITMAPFYYQGQPMLRPGYLASERSAGGMLSTNSDMLVFLKAYFSGRLFPKKYIEENQHWLPIQIVPLEYGTNLMKLGNLIGHSGSTGTIAYYLPQSDLYIVGATGQLDTHKAMMLTINILQALGYRVF